MARRKKGDKSKNAKIAFVGIVYTLRKTPHGVEGPIHKRMLIATAMNPSSARRVEWRSSLRCWSAMTRA